MNEQKILPLKILIFYQFIMVRREKAVKEVEWLSQCGGR